MLVIFSLKTVERGRKREMTHLYAYWIMDMAHHKQPLKWNAKGT